MRGKKQERRLLVLTYLLCIALFTNLAILKDPIDQTALSMGVALCVIIGVAHFVIRKFYPDGDKFILTFSCILSVVGIAVLYRIDPADAFKQLIWFVLGIISFILIVVLLPDLKSFGKYKKVFLIITLIFMPMALLLGKEIYGATNWVIIGGFSFQPSEFAKIGLVLYLSAAMMNYEDKHSMKADFKQLLEPALVVMFSLGCLVLQRDLGSALIFFGITITMLYIATSKKKYAFTALGLFSAGCVVAYNLFGHVRNRVLIWQDPWAYANEQGFQIVQGLYSISSGGPFGSGLGQGYPGFVPVNKSDYIFAIICEELGMVFGIGIVILFFLLFYRGIRASFITKDNFTKLNAVGFSTMIACQVLVIIGGIFTLIPLTGIALPLVSYGGTSMLTIFFALGILQKISEEG
ncbi:MAG: FtsW/RodA/SpoVE family cell cycle protein [Clostridium sp.]